MEHRAKMVKQTIPPQILKYPFPSTFICSIRDYFVFIKLSLYCKTSAVIKPGSLM